jgi:hypothetical protein
VSLLSNSEISYVQNAESSFLLLELIETFYEITEQNPSIISKVFQNLFLFLIDILRSLVESCLNDGCVL